MSWVRESAEGVLLSIRVVPRAKKDETAGEVGDAMKVRLRAPPVDNKANKALVAFLADKLGIPPRRINIVAGRTNRNKTVLLRGCRIADVEGLPGNPGCTKSPEPPGVIVSESCGTGGDAGSAAAP